MKIFNKGSRHFITGFGPIAPGGTPKDVPSENAEEAKALLLKYPNELVEGGAADAEMKASTNAIAAKDKALAEKDAELAKLRDQNAKLKRLVDSDAKEVVKPASVTAPAHKK